MLERIVLFPVVDNFARRSLFHNLFHDFFDFHFFFSSGCRSGGRLRFRLGLRLSLLLGLRLRLRLWLRLSLLLGLRLRLRLGLRLSLLLWLRLRLRLSLWLRLWLRLRLSLRLGLRLRLRFRFRLRFGSGLFVGLRIFVRLRTAVVAAGGVADLVVAAVVNPPIEVQGCNDFLAIGLGAGDRAKVTDTNAVVCTFQFARVLDFGQIGGNVAFGELVGDSLGCLLAGLDADLNNVLSILLGLVAAAKDRCGFCRGGCGGFSRGFGCIVAGKRLQGDQFRFFFCRSFSLFDRLSGRGCLGFVHLGDDIFFAGITSDEERTGECAHAEFISRKRFHSKLR